MKKTILICLISLQSFLILGCTGVNTYPNKIKAGETATIGMGYLKNFSRDNTTVTITHATDFPVTYQPGDSGIRGIINLYPDPVSYLNVGTETNRKEEAFKFGGDYGEILNTLYTNDDKDWWQTIAFIDIPFWLSPGEATITLTNSTGDSVSTLTEIESGTATRDLFNVPILGALSEIQIESLSRSPHVEVSFTSAILPHAIEVLLSHDPDMDNGGTGRLHIVNTRGDIKNILWSDNGTQLKVILMPVGNKEFTHINDLKFYIAGEIQNVVEVNTLAFDINGNSIQGTDTTLISRN